MAQNAAILLFQPLAAHIPILPHVCHLKWGSENHEENDPTQSSKLTGINSLTAKLVNPLNTVIYCCPISWDLTSLRGLNSFTRVVLMVKCKTAVSPLLMHWRYCSFAISHWYTVVHSPLTRDLEIPLCVLSWLLRWSWWPRECKQENLS